MSRFAFSAALALAAGVAASGAAHANLLYVTDGDSQRLAIVDTTTATLVNVTGTHQGGYPIAVRNSVWIGNYYGPNAAEYTLAGAPTGNTAPSASVFAVDGTAVGGVNYELGDAFGSGPTVYTANINWTNPTAAFGPIVPGGGDFVGITYDSALNVLWISNNTTIFEYSLGGGLLGQFAHQSGRGSLAYDDTTDTLWFVRNGSDSIDQYSKTGTLLQTENIVGLAANNWGSEFALHAVAAAPEPASLGLFGGALLLLQRLRRRRG
jgi:hypothetical protein